MVITGFVLILLQHCFCFVPCFEQFTVLSHIYIALSFLYVLLHGVSVELIIFCTSYCTFALVFLLIMFCIMSLYCNVLSNVKYVLTVTSQGKMDVSCNARIRPLHLKLCLLLCTVPFKKQISTFICAKSD